MSKYKMLTEWADIDAAYKAGKLLVWLDNSNFPGISKEEITKHWHPVTELPCWGVEWAEREKFARR